MTGHDIRSVEEREALLDKEIAERQKLKEAYRLVREDLARTQGGNGTQTQSDKHTGSFFPFAPMDFAKRLGTTKEYGQTTQLVKIAISGMPGDYNIRDIYRYLQGHGHQLGMLAIATVLNRLKKTGEIKVRVNGSGRRPTLFKR